MSGRRTLFLDESVGEARGVVFLDDRPERLLIARDGEDPRLKLGARLVVRIAQVEPAIATAFADLGDGLEAILPFRPEERPVRGQALEAEIRTEPRAGKLATLRPIGPAEGAPRLIAPPPSLADQLQAFARDAAIVRGREAREAADLAESEALAVLHPLPGGGVLAVEPTRALTALDIDLGERKGQDAKRVTRAANLAAIGLSARVLRLKGLGGLVVFDFAGRGHDGAALLAAARVAFAPDNPGVAMGPISRFGTLELTIPRRTPPLADALLDETGRPTVLTQALRLIRGLESAGIGDPGGRFEGQAAPDVIAAAEPLKDRLSAIMGARFALAPQPGWPRDQLDVRRP